MPNGRFGTVCGCVHMGFERMERVRRTVLSLGWCGRRGAARGLLLIMVGVHGLTVKKCKLQFDTNDASDSALCGPHGTFRNILELICNMPFEFKLRLHHGLNQDVQEWLTGFDNVI